MRIQLAVDSEDRTSAQLFIVSMTKEGFLTIEGPFSS
jgi:hypothetical protein